MIPSNSPDSGAGIDLSQFYQVFFEEAGENLDAFERMLLGIDIERADDETLNSVFRCAHSVKGGAATFGFADVAELTHQMETLLDKLRRHELAPAPAMVDVLLRAGDALRAQLARHQRGGEGDAIATQELLAAIRALCGGHAAPAPRVPPAVAAPAAPAGARRELELVVGPLERPADADGIVELFTEIADLGTIAPLDGGRAVDGRRRFKLVTTSSDDELVNLFTFHVAREQIAFAPVAAGPALQAGAPAGRAAVAATPPLPARSASLPVAAPPEAATLRVSVEKVDQLINLVGELVITQAMLAQNSADIGAAAGRRLAKSLADLERNTRDLQQSVMAIRMIPMSVVFARFPRMLRDLSAKLGKKVEFVTHGEATELDKGLVERITDPLTHLVRNSCDHGIELPAERAAHGKPEVGTITLAASHQGGSIVIEVRDDGRGLSRDKLLAKARERGIAAPDTMSDAEVWNLIFAPGFSTAEIVTDVSGRGVGMDVVKRNITGLGGTVEIESTEGLGMSVRVRLPLTLAIMDGMSVAVGGECYILPLASVVESFQIHAGSIRTIGGSGQVVQVRDDYLPVVALQRVFDVPRLAGDVDAGVMVVVEADGRRAALQVDELIGQQQVVVKNLEANYRRVADVSGATIMGDGRVALILDVAALARRARH